MRRYASFHRDESHGGLVLCEQLVRRAEGTRQLRAQRLGRGRFDLLIGIGKIDSRDLVRFCQAFQIGRKVRSRGVSQERDADALFLSGGSRGRQGLRECAAVHGHHTFSGTT